MITKDNLVFVKQFEGLKLEAYCATEQEEREGKYTIGYGHVLVGGEEDTLGHPIGITRKWSKITNKDAERLLMNDLVGMDSKLSKYLPEASMSDIQRIAVLSLIYNIGMANFTKSKVFEHLANRDHERAAYFFRSFTRQAGLRILGLVRRRAVEKIFFQQGINAYKDVWSGKIDPYEVLDLTKIEEQ